MLNKVVSIITYQTGNVGSVAKKIKRLGYEPVMASEPEQVLSAGKLILPGVGHFASAVEKLKNSGLWDALNEAVLIRKIPIMGICLGMQLMAAKSEEGKCNGLGWFDAEVVRFQVSDNKKFKIPHMGWNTIEPVEKSILLDGIGSSDEFYFIHSYHINCNQHTDVLAKTNYSYDFVAAIQKDNIYGVQFHPEKSHNAGEKLLSNFLKI